MTKKDQTSWKKRNKKMSFKKFCEYRSWLFLEFPVCQICGDHASCEAHHAKYGMFGADRDDRYIVALCHPCHHEIHHGRGGYEKLGITRDEVEIIGELNYERFKNSQ